MNSTEIGSIFEIGAEALFARGAGEFKLPLMRDTGSWHTAFFNTGRAAAEALLRYLKKETGLKKLLLPSYICSSITGAVRRSGLPYAYYGVTDTLEPDAFDLEKNLEPSAAVYITPYFGPLKDSHLLRLISQMKQQGIVVIEDVTTCLFSRTSQGLCFGDYILGSLRKWLPVPDGAVLLSKDMLPAFEKQCAGNDYSLYYLAAQVMKTHYLSNRALDKNLYLTYAGLANKALFSDYAIREMSEITRALLPSCDIDDMVKKRTANHDFLYDALLEKSCVAPVMKRTENCVPMGLPILCPNRDALRAYLTSNGIYCSIHWDRNPECPWDKIGHERSDCVLTLPCDQRYGPEEMKTIACRINTFKTTETAVCRHV